MADDADGTALMVFVFYMVLMSSIAARGFFKNRAAKAEAADNQGDAAHFLGQQDFGKVVIFLNMVATFVSGYVVVGVPELANALGFAGGLCFLTICTTAGSMTPLWAKICRISKARGYQGPNDFTGDRYNSRTLQLLGTFGGFLQGFFVVGKIDANFFQNNFGVVFNNTQGRVIQDFIVRNLTFNVSRCR